MGKHTSLLFYGILTNQICAFHIPKTQYFKDSAKQNIELFLLISSSSFHTTTIFVAAFMNNY